MSRWLVDTQALVWFLDGDQRLSTAATETMRDRRNALLVSAATVWEIAIKSAIGKLSAPDDLPAEIAREDFAVLPIEGHHAWRVASLPKSSHKDPFDRILAAQALAEGIPIISRDASFDAYGVERHW
jgi:PIN domain nuclease of toxin-antitoxin system